MTKYLRSTRAANNSNLTIGTAQQDNLTGSTADEQISGLAGNDIINALDGNDYLAGGKGKDTLSGDSGDDHLYGGLESDNLRGGSGQDNFYFNFWQNEGIDTITDFSVKEDHVILTDIHQQPLDQNLLQLIVPEILSTAVQEGNNTRVILSVPQSGLFETNSTEIILENTQKEDLTYSIFGLPNPNQAPIWSIGEKTISSTSSTTSSNILYQPTSVKSITDHSYSPLNNWIISDLNQDELTLTLTLRDSDDQSDYVNLSGLEDADKTTDGFQIIAKPDELNDILQNQLFFDFSKTNLNDITCTATLTDGEFTFKKTIVFQFNGDSATPAHDIQSNSGNTITGNTRDNYLIGNQGNDTVIGNLGNDTLSGGQGDDLVIGGAGKDTFVYQIAYNNSNNIQNTNTDDNSNSENIWIGQDGLDTIVVDTSDQLLLVIPIPDQSSSNITNPVSNTDTNTDTSNNTSNNTSNDIFTFNFNDLLAAESAGQFLISNNGKEVYWIFDNSLDTDYQASGASMIIIQGIPQTQVKNIHSVESLNAVLPIHLEVQVVGSNSSNTITSNDSTLPNSTLIV